MKNDNKKNSMEILPRRSKDIVHRAVHQLEDQITHHIRSDSIIYPRWTNYSSQQQLRQAVADDQKKCVWIATWGGILCWFPKEQTCVRYTSEHGLPGNSIASIAVDSEGTVWAAGQQRGLVYLNHDGQWVQHPKFQFWRVRKIIPRQTRGIYLTLDNVNDETAVGVIDDPNGDLQILIEEGLESLEILTMLDQPDTNSIWAGNAWGLHKISPTLRPITFDIDRSQVRSLAPAIGGGFWVGTNHGLYHFNVIDGEPKVTRNQEWPEGEILDLLLENNGNLWIVTPDAIGRLTNNIWQPIREALPFEAGFARFASIRLFSTQQHNDSHWISEGQIWIVGPERLFQVSIETSKPAFFSHSDDQLSNAIQTVVIYNNKLWTGSAGGLCVLDGAKWKFFSSDIPDMADIRAILDIADEQLLVGAWHKGLHRFVSEVHVPDNNFQERVVALVHGSKNTIWLATIDSLYVKKDKLTKWEMVLPKAADYLGSGIIQSICFQVVKDRGEVIPILWVGTSNGLWRYRPTYEIWDQASGELDSLSINAIQIDPLADQIWVGTRQGLFSSSEWKCFLPGIEILSMTFGVSGSIWLGTRNGLYHWPSPKDGKCFLSEPLEHFVTLNSGLPSNLVTALNNHQRDDYPSLQIGTSNGLAVLRL